MRLVCDLGPHRALSSRDPTRTAMALAQLPPADRNPRLIPAILHSAHNLSIPIKLGVNFVAKSQHFFWSVQQCVCSLEGAVFLSRWLHQIGQSKGQYPSSGASVPDSLVQTYIILGPGLANDRRYARKRTASLTMDQSHCG